MRIPNLQLTAPIDRWDEAVPLGNGLMGALLWGDGRTIRLSLDRGDLWDLRRPEFFKKKDFTYATLKKLVARKDTQTIIDLFEQPGGRIAYPTKIPAGRLELTGGRDQAPRLFTLDLATAVGAVQMRSGQIEVFCSATAPVGMIRIHGPTPAAAIIPAAFGKQERNPSRDSLSQLRYPAPVSGRAGATRWTVQRTTEGFAYAIVLSVAHRAGCTEIAFTIRTSHDSPDPVADGRRIVDAALKAGYAAMLRPHVKWWKAFWAQSSVRLPDQDIERHYHLVQYFYGAASRRGAPPIPLQGVWTADEGTIPPWRGDYHNDLNTQLTYWAYLSANHLDEGMSFLDFLWNLLPAFRRYAKDFFHVGGACMPGVMALDGQAMAGWSQYCFSPTNGAWVAHAFYQHWRYTMDPQFLAERAYPFCREIGEGLEGLLRPGKDGTLRLPLSSSPEIHGNGLPAWLTPNSNFDLALLRWLYSALAEMAQTLGDRSAAGRWRRLLGRLPHLAIAKENFWDQPGIGGLMLSPDEKLKESHRHHSHLMAIHPLGLVTMEGSDRDRAVIYDSLRVIDHLGMAFWCGYSFPWMSCIAARALQPARALSMLELYLKGFVSRNGFHLNGDYKGQGLAAPDYRPFTMEGNFAAAQAVHEMLLQSWGGVVRIFPAVPSAWRDTAFENLRAEGAFRVSARRKGGHTVYVRVQAERDGVVQLKDPFGPGRVRWNRRRLTKRQNRYVCLLKAGDILEGWMKE